MKLAIISHTEHYRAPDGNILGWGPTITEINHLLDIFDEIYHVAMLYDKVAPPSALPYVSNRITFVPIPAVGGKSISSKINSIRNAPKIISIVSNTLKKIDVFQLRAPTGIGVFLIPYLTLFIKKKGWFKYAGNWNQSQPPLGYAIQRFMLKQQSRKVTINGQWEMQPKHCITFENPCLTEKNLIEGDLAIEHKSKEDKLIFCFVGRLERQKGVERIIKAFNNLEESDKNKINEVHFIGDGEEKEYFIKLTKNSGVKFHFHGFLPRNQVFDVYKKANVFLLPSSASEGFPKVIAEAINFGCIPLVSNVSSIAQYVRHGKNGIVLDSLTINNLNKELKKVLNLSRIEYNHLLRARKELIHKFTFEYYNNRIKNDILK
ncbi:capsular biosynthesis protein [Flavobacteriales bacterium 34_180_T64]|nr:capsular biosynthesis protein [Flavobacteriales bacterium 34_180_T64]